MFYLRNGRIITHGISKINLTSCRLYSESECEGVRRCDKAVINPQNLPYLPIPKLENTLEAFVKSCEPFLSYAVMKETKNICDSFQRKEGKDLQRYLISKAQHSHNWLDDWYTQCAYLCNRDSLPMSTSPIITFPPQKFEKTSDKKEYIAKLILAILKFRKLCYCNLLPVDTWQKYPLDMGVYKRLFSNIRLPKPERDQLFHFPDSQHIIVIFRNNFFKVKVLGSCGEHISLRQLTDIIHGVMMKVKATGVPLGLLTSLNRDRWASVYKHMKDIGPNVELLEHIEKSMFVVNIDDAPPCPICSDEDRKLNSCQNGFHGHGPKINGANRWYGKTLQFYITRDGCSGIIFEHSPVDTIPLGRMADYIIDSINASEWLDDPNIVMREQPLKMEFAVTEQMSQAINEAAEHLEEKMRNFKVKMLHYDRYGKDFVKANQLSPDAIIQATLQHAHFKIYNRIVPQHETASTRRFFLGRTDIIRSCTNEVLLFLKNMSIARATAREKYALLANAAKRHKQITEDVMMGRGIDRHLFGLLIASKELKMPTPELLRCEAYNKSSKFRIVTRQNAMKRNCFTCYAPGPDGGYGCCYNPRSEDINMCVTCRTSDSECDPGEFLDAWACSMKDIGGLLLLHKYREGTIGKEEISKWSLPT